MDSPLRATLASALAGAIVAGSCATCERARLGNVEQPPEDHLARHAAEEAEEYLRLMVRDA